MIATALKAILEKIRDREGRFLEAYQDEPEMGAPWRIPNTERLRTEML